MLQQHSKQMIAAYVLNCPVQEAFQRQANAAQKADIDKLEYAFESCIAAIAPMLKKHGESVIEERDHIVFALMPSSLAIKIIQKELDLLGIQLDGDSTKQSLSLALDNTNGFILRKVK